MVFRLRFITLAAIIFTLLVLALAVPRAVSAMFLNLANVNIVRAASLPADATRRGVALAEAEAQLMQARTHPRAALAEARVALARGNPQRAADALRASGDALSDDPIAQFVWAEAEWQAGNPDAAFEHWRAAGALVYFLNQAYRVGDRHQWKQAENYARIAIGITPERAEPHYLLGDALTRQSPENREGLRALDRAEELARDNELLSTILSRKGEVMAAQARFDDALTYFDRARQAAPLDARPRTGAALVWLQTQPEKRAQAEALLMQVVIDSPWYVAAYDALARSAEARGDLMGAEEWYRKGLEKNRNDARLLFALGEFYARQNRLDEAKAMLLLALKYETRADDLQAITRALERLNAR
jgi:tetratricopeptide (TPR) repeat protein